MEIIKLKIINFNKYPILKNKVKEWKQEFHLKQKLISNLEILNFKTIFNSVIYNKDTRFKK